MPGILTKKSNAPDNTSTDYDVMLPYWNKVDTIMDGAEAMRLAGEIYLPQFPNESNEDYTYRSKNAKFTNIFADIITNLAAKPFAEEVTLGDNTPPQIEALAEDIDGKGNSLHVFASRTFFDGIKSAVDWIFVDFTKAVQNPDNTPLTIAQEKEQGLRPYWVHIPAKRMIAVYSDVVGGKEIFVHVRMIENQIVRQDFNEYFVERIRVLNRDPIYNEFGRITGYSPATYTVYEKQILSNRQRTQSWVVVDEGPVTIGVIPLVPFITGRRIGSSWAFIPPMQDAADLQIEHYQQETALKSIKELTAFPMLAGNGVAPEMLNGEPKPVPTGPRAVLYAPPTISSNNSQHGEWQIIEPSAESLKFLAEDVKATEQQLRELGRQPLTAQTGNLTVVTTAFAAQKGNSAIMAWALNLKDALEQAFVYTAQWLKLQDTTTVTVFTDFALELGDDKGPDFLLAMRKSGDLSRETLWFEAQRRNILSADFDPKAEQTNLDNEAPQAPNPQDIVAAMGVRPRTPTLVA